MNNFNLQNKSIVVAGHKGMVGSAICRQLKKHQVETLVVNKSKLDLTDTNSVGAWMLKKTRRRDTRCCTCCWYFS